MRFFLNWFNWARLKQVTHGVSLIRRRTDWSESKKEIKLVARRDKKKIKRRANCFRWPKAAPKFSKFFKIC